MITAIKMAEFAEKNGWIVIEEDNKKDDSFIRYLTPAGKRVLVQFYDNGGIRCIYP